MLNEENAILNGSATSVYAPWGDGTNNWGYNGLNNLVTTGNGTPANQIQTAVGGLTTAMIDNQLTRLYNQGARGFYIVANPQEVQSLVHLAEASGTVIRVTASSADGKTVLGVTVTGYIHPITGEIVDVIASRFQQAGTMLFMATTLPDGSPAADVDVLPQVQLPQFSMDGNSVQGYTVQEIMPTVAAPQVYNFLVSVFETVRLKSALHAAISSGITAV